MLFALDRFDLPDEYRLHWVRASGANLTMAQEFIGQPHVLGQAWTLSYELVFYAVVSSLLCPEARQAARRSSCSSAWRRAVCSGGSSARMRMARRATTPRASTGGGRARLAVLGAAAAPCSPAARSAARWRPAGFARRHRALVANRVHPAWFSLLLFTSMFVGWVLHRWFSG